MSNVKLITIVKNRLDHFLHTFPFMVSQYGTFYDFVIVDYHSNDGLSDRIPGLIDAKKISFSPYLKKIYKISLDVDQKFNSKKARNLGAAWFKNEENIFAFCDVDTFIGMSYVDKWSRLTIKNKTFIVTRQQDTRAAHPSRLSPEVNYGNLVIHSSDYFDVEGYDESMSYYGGGDDDIFHRLKLSNLREINPYSPIDACQFSIVHGEEDRLLELEEPRRADKDITFSKVYKNTKRKVSNNKFINLDYSKTISNIQVMYEK